MTVEEREFCLKKYKKFVQTGLFVIVLSIASTGVSFLHVVGGGWVSDVIGIPEEEYWEVKITRHGFPYGWYAIIIYTVGGHIEEVTTEFRSEPFIVDTMIYIFLYSLMAGIILWLYRLYALKSQNTSLIKPQK